MMCPNCGAPLIVLELEGVEIDFCTACGGLWLDAGELEQILTLSGEGTGRLSEALRQASVRGRGARRCPRCRKRMEIIHLGETVPVELDRCPRGHGLWLDRGEFERVLGQFGEGEAGPVARFLSEMLGHDLKTRGGGPHNA